MEFNDNQKQAISFYKGCCNCIASAGSGKTAVLVHRIENLVMEHDVDPNRILAITFSKKAKENMLKRLENLLPEQYKYLHIETFHSFGYSLIRKFNRCSYKLLDSDWKKRQIIEGILKEMLRVPEVNGNLVAGCLSYISMQKNRLIPPDMKSKKDEERVYVLYEKYKREHSCIDFDDMLTLADEILAGNEKALGYCQKHYEFILADEMQDTNTAQYRMVQLIAQRHQNVFFVGDPLQEIYEWRGSTNRYMLDFNQEWDNNPTIVNLNCNYRSTADIVEFANRFAQTVPESQHPFYVESFANKGAYKLPEFALYSDERMEAGQITDKIRQMVESKSYRYQDIAILARTNAQLANFESAMHRAAIPYRVVDGIPFAERKEIRIVLSYLRLVHDKNDDHAFQYIYNKPNRYLGNAFLEETKKIAMREKKSEFYAMYDAAERNWKYKKGVQELSDIIGYIGNVRWNNVKEIISFLRTRLKLDLYVSDEASDDNNADDKVDNLNTLESIAEEYESIEQFITYMGKLVTVKDEQDDAVQIMTIHKSKGLEFPVVFLVGVNEGLLPHHRNENINEERRLMYVAITRAERELYLSASSQYGKKQTNPSRFIEELFGNN